MRKKIVCRCLIGAPIGVTIGMLITVLISYIYGDGMYYPVAPALIEMSGNEINAVSLQMICMLFYGAVWGGVSVIWEKDEWSILRQTLTHLLITSAGTFPFAWLMHWMEHSIVGALGYFGIYFVIYFVIWISQYMAIRKKLKQINQRIREE